MKRLTALFAALALAGCQTAGPVRPDLPVLPGDLATLCKLPALKAGDDARLVLSRHRAELKRCASRHGRLVEFYDALREGLR